MLTAISLSLSGELTDEVKRSQQGREIKSLEKEAEIQRLEAYYKDKIMKLEEKLKEQKQELIEQKRQNMEYADEIKYLTLLKQSSANKGAAAQQRPTSNKSDTVSEYPSLERELNSLREAVIEYKKKNDALEHALYTERSNRSTLELNLEKLKVQSNRFKTFIDKIKANELMLGKTEQRIPRLSTSDLYKRPDSLSEAHSNSLPIYEEAVSVKISNNTDAEERGSQSVADPSSNAKRNSESGAWVYSTPSRNTMKKELQNSFENTANYSTMETTVQITKGQRDRSEESKAQRLAKEIQRLNLKLAEDMHVMDSKIYNYNNNVSSVIEQIAHEIKLFKQEDKSLTQEIERLAKTSQTNKLLEKLRDAYQATKKTIMQILRTIESHKSSL